MVHVAFPMIRINVLIFGGLANQVRGKQNYPNDSVRQQIFHRPEKPRSYFQLKSFRWSGARQKKKKICSNWLPDEPYSPDR